MIPSLPSPTAATPLPPERLWRVSVAAWAGVCVFFATRTYLVSVFARGTPFRWLADLPETLVTYGQWALYTPLVVRLAERHPIVEGRGWRRVPVHLAASTALALLAVSVIWGVDQVVWADEPPPFGRLFAVAFHWHFLWYWIVVGVTQAAAYHRLWRDRQLHASMLQTELVRAQLQALKAQIQPHFLYNTLNTISEMVHQDAEAADRMISHLADLLRSTVDASAAQEVPLARELEFLAPYVEIERTRFHDRLSVEMEIAPETLDARVPSLVLQPLVENAVRHGVGPLTGGGRIAIRAAREGGYLVLRVEDSGEGAGARRGTGVGLANVTARLRHLYGPAAAFELRHDAGGTVASIRLPYRPSGGRP
ncbi:MAG TPA: sensor histidine kinase [Longimicrobiaceae bacterium]